MKKLIFAMAGILLASISIEARVRINKSDFVARDHSGNHSLRLRRPTVTILKEEPLPVGPGPVIVSKNTTGKSKQYRSATTPSIDLADYGPPPPLPNNASSGKS